MAAGARIVNVPISRGCRGCPPEKLPSHPQTPISPNSQNLTQLSGLKRIFRSNPLEHIMSLQNELWGNSQKLPFWSFWLDAIDIGQIDCKCQIRVTQFSAKVWWNWKLMKINEIETEFIVGQKNVAAAEVPFTLFWLETFTLFDWKPAWTLVFLSMEAKAQWKSWRRAIYEIENTSIVGQKKVAFAVERVFFHTFFYESKSLTKYKIYENLRNWKHFNCWSKEGGFCSGGRKTTFLRSFLSHLFDQELA